MKLQFQMKNKIAGKIEDYNFHWDCQGSVDEEVAVQPPYLKEVVDSPYCGYLGLEPADGNVVCWALQHLGS